MKEELTGVVRLVSEPSMESIKLGFLDRPKVQLIQGANIVTNLGWWLKMRGFEGKRVRITVEQLPAE